jgi:RNA polymerase sigma-70 factor (ECF subfamily)
LVAAAGSESTPESRAALATLCELYWRPLYAYVRRQGYRVCEAEDLTQGFFSKLLTSDLLKTADRNLGRFRSYLLGALKHYLQTEAARDSAVKRGGRQKFISLNVEDAELMLNCGLVDNRSAEAVFDREWAMTVIRRAMERLGEEFAHAGKAELFGHLQARLTRPDSTSGYYELGLTLQMNESAVKVAVHRMRRRYRQLVRLEIGRTVQSPTEIDEEVRDLFAALRH